MIRFIVETFSSAFDRSGNRSHCATITSTLTGKSLQVCHVGGPRNVPGIVRNLLACDWSSVHAIEIDNIPRSQFKDAGRYDSGVMESALTADMILALEHGGPRVDAMRNALAECRDLLACYGGSHLPIRESRRVGNVVTDSTK